MPTAPAPFVLQLFLHQEPKTQPTAPSERNDSGAGTTAPGDPQGGGTGPAPTQEQPCNSMSFGMIGLFLALMWFMVLRPESKRRKETAAMLGALKQGDTVVTIGGMHGVVASIQDKTMVLKVGDQKMTFDRSAIARVVRDDAARPDAGKADKPATK